MEVKALQQLLSQFRQMQENLQKQVDDVTSKPRLAAAWSSSK